MAINYEVKMKTIILVLFLAIGYGAFGQEVDNTLKRDNTNIYYDAAYRYFTSEKSVTGKASTTILFEESYFTQFMPDKIGNFVIVAANPHEKKLFKRIRKEKYIEMLRISPLKVTPSGKFKVSIVYFDVSNPKRKNLEFVNKGGVDVVYSYDSSKSKFLFEQIQ